MEGQMFSLGDLVLHKTNSEHIFIVIGNTTLLDELQNPHTACYCYNLLLGNRTFFEIELKKH